jgi:hypothetical protein
VFWVSGADRTVFGARRGRVAGGAHVEAAAPRSLNLGSSWTAAPAGGDAAESPGSAGCDDLGDTL